MESDKNICVKNEKKRTENEEMKLRRLSDPYAAGQSRISEMGGHSRR